MTEIVLNTSTLPEPLYRLIQTEKVKVHEADGEIRLTPIIDTKKSCPLRGRKTILILIHRAQAS